MKTICRNFSYDSLALHIFNLPSLKFIDHARVLKGACYVWKKFAWGSSFTLFLLLSTSFTTTVGFVSPTQASAASGIDLDTFYDNFNDNSIDSSLWGTGSFPGSDPLVTVNEVNSQLVITPRAGQTGLHYNGLISNRTHNLTQGIIFVEVVEATQGQANTIIMW